MTLRATEEETSKKLRGQPDFLNLSMANYTLRFIDMKVLHVHRVNRSEDIRCSLDDALSGLWQNHRGTGRQENELVAIANGNERQKVTLHENYLRIEANNARYPRKVDNILKLIGGFRLNHLLIAEPQLPPRISRHVDSAQEQPPVAGNGTVSG